MINVTATDFKAKCLALLDEVAKTGELIVITKHGRPVAQVSPASPSPHRYPQESLFGTVETVGDIVEPAIPAEAWEAERGLLG